MVRLVEGRPPSNGRNFKFFPELRLYSTLKEQLLFALPLSPVSKYIISDGVLNRLKIINNVGPIYNKPFEEFMIISVIYYYGATFFHLAVNNSRPLHDDDHFLKGSIQLILSSYRACIEFSILRVYSFQREIEISCVIWLRFFIIIIYK